LNKKHFKKTDAVYYEIENCFACIFLCEIVVSLDELNEARYDCEVYDSLHDMNHPGGTQKRYNAKIANFIMTYYSEQEIHLENLKNKQP
jgi:hypothetical protein